MSPTPPRRRIGVFVLPSARGDASVLTRRIVQAARDVENVGFDAFWLAEGHFGTIGVSSALTVLAGAAAATERIDLGTAVVPIAFDSPLRLAEVAASVHALSGGRLQLGVGKGNGHGFSSQAYRAFGLDETGREELYWGALADLRTLLTSGARVDGERVALYPPPADLATRLWQATSGEATAVAAARSGDGLQLHRVVRAGDTGTVQRALVDAYVTAYPATAATAPRIAVSRAVFVAASRGDALERIGAILRDDPGALPLGQSGQTALDYVCLSNTHVGSPAEIAASLGEDPTVRAATDLLLAPVLPLADAGFADQLVGIAEASDHGLRTPALASTL